MRLKRANIVNFFKFMMVLIEFLNFYNGNIRFLCEIGCVCINSDKKRRDRSAATLERERYMYYLTMIFLPPAM